MKSLQIERRAVFKVAKSTYGPLPTFYWISFKFGHKLLQVLT